MSGVYFESKRVGDISCTHVKVGGVEAIMKQIGERKVIESKGRGNGLYAKCQTSTGLNPSFVVETNSDRDQWKDYDLNAFSAEENK